MAHHQRSLPGDQVSAQLQTAAAILRALKPEVLAEKIEAAATRIPQVDSVLENGSACLVLHGHLDVALAQARLTRRLFAL